MRTFAVGLVVLGGWVSSSGCRPEGTCTPELVGPDVSLEITRDLWERTVDRLHRPLCVDRIEFRDEISSHGLRLPDDYELGGRARATAAGTVLLIRNSTSERAVRSVLVHELCHAASFQHGLSRRPDGIPHVEEDVVPDRWREEAFAQWCDLGADAPAMLDQALPLDAAEASMVRWLREEVWRDGVPTVAAPTVLAAGLEVALPRPVTAHAALGFTPRGALAMFADDGSQILVSLGGDVEVRDPNEHEMDLFARTPVLEPPRFLHGLEVWAASDTWIPVGDLRVGTLSWILPTGRNVRMVVAVSTEPGRAPTPLLGEAGRLVGDADGVVALVQIDPDGQSLRLFAWDMAR